MQNLYDSWQLANILKIKCTSYNKDLSKCANTSEMTAIQQYGASMRGLLGPGSQTPATGMFATSCIAHCQSIENEHPQALWHWPGRWGIDGKTAGLPDGGVHYPRETFGDWYFGRAPEAGHAVAQQCDWGPQCNPLCPLFT